MAVFATRPPQAGQSLAADEPVDFGQGSVVVWKTPVPGMPTVDRLPFRLIVFVNPRGPKEMLGPERDMFRRMLGAIFIRRKNRQPTRVSN